VSAEPPLELSDFSAIIPVRIDTTDRLRNLRAVLGWFERYVHGAELLVLEHAERAQCEALAREFHAAHFFRPSQGCFHKSRVFNLGLALASRRFALLYDCDVLLDPAALARCAHLLRAGEASFVYPYDGVMLQVRPEAGGRPWELLARAWGGGAQDALPPGLEPLHGTPDDPSSGGALAADRRALILAGGLNENIVSYGCEDTELETRLRKLGHAPARLAGFHCFHLHHRRGPDSHYNGLHASNLAEWRKVEAMSPEQVARYVHNGMRALQLDARRPLRIHDTPQRFALELGGSQRHPLPDTAFLLAVPGDLRLPPALISDLLDRLEAAYEAYDFHLVELGAGRHRPLSHREQVVFAAWPDVPRSRWLARALAETDRELLVVCTPFLSAAPEELLPVLQRLGAGEPGVIPLSEVAAPGGLGERVRTALRARLPGPPRPLAARRSELERWQAQAAGPGGASGESDR
jgi:hypothetical protein